MVVEGAAGDTNFTAVEVAKRIRMASIGVVGLSSWSSFPSRPPQTLLVWMVGDGGCGHLLGMVGPGTEPKGATSKAPGCWGRLAYPIC